MSDSRMNTQLAEVANRLVQGQFVYIWSTPEGLPYCPRRVIAMVSYLWTVLYSNSNPISTSERLDTLKKILNCMCMDLERREMIRAALAMVFSPRSFHQFSAPTHLPLEMPIYQFYPSLSSSHLLVYPH